jgi:uncharacterized protein YdaU (DUF1376 family)
VNYYEHHIGDYAAATAHLSWDEDMAYTRLLRAYYHHERGIPDGEQYRLARALSKPHRAAVDVVLKEFFSLLDGTWHQKRADSEVARFKDKQAKAKRSADARWAGRDQQSECNADGSPNAMRSDMRSHSEGNAHQTPDTNPNQKKNQEIAAPDGATPTRKSKKVTFKAWKSTFHRGSEAIPADHAVFKFAADAGIPQEFLGLAWSWFCRRYANDEKTYTPKGWPTVFQKSVESNWGKLWWVEPDGSYKLTTVGMQLQRVLEARSREHAEQAA